MLTVVQSISTCWSKDYRGGPRAGIRNRVPEAELLEFPVEWPESHPVVVQRLDYSFFVAWDGEVKETRLASARSASLAAPLHLDSVWIYAGDRQISVDYHWTWQEGMPERRTLKRVLVLSPGEWGRVRYNARKSRTYDSQAEWFYEKHVINIGLFEIVDPRVFLDTRPAKIHSQMAQLW